MYVTLPVGDERFEVELDLPAAQITVAEKSITRPPRELEDLSEEALQNPMGTPKLCEHDLKGKKVAIMVDDKTRPTPAYRIIPYVLKELKQAGVHDDDISFVAASGEHFPIMNREELVQKVGVETVERYHVIAHDGFDWEELVFRGFTNLGTPIWVNKTVAESDFKIAIGRIALHSGCGYEGGAKMILPGVSSLETITRNHAMFLSPNAGVGTLDENPGRTDAEDAAGIVGLDFILNIVCEKRGRDFWGVSGHYITAHRAGVQFGDEHVWGAAIPEKADITIAAPGGGPTSQSEAFNGMAAQTAGFGTKPGGSLILLRSSKDVEDGTPSGPLDNMDFEDVLRHYEKRNWQLSRHEYCTTRRQVGAQHRLRAPFWGRHVTLVGGKVPEGVLRQCGMKHTASLEEAVSEAVDRHGKEARVVVLPEAAATLPVPPR